MDVLESAVVINSMQIDPRMCTAQIMQCESGTAQNRASEINPKEVSIQTNQANTEVDKSPAVSQGNSGQHHRLDQDVAMNKENASSQYEKNSLPTEVIQSAAAPNLKEGGMADPTLVGEVTVPSLLAAKVLYSLLKEHPQGIPLVEGRYIPLSEIQRLFSHEILPSMLEEAFKYSLKLRMRSALPDEQKTLSEICGQRRPEFLREELVLLVPLDEFFEKLQEFTCAFHLSF